MKKWISGWGRYPKQLAECHAPHSVSQLEALLAASHADHAPWIPRGLGRSYGDSALSSTLYSSARLNRFLNFDAANGILDCQSGVSLADILSIVVPQGWFLPVTPGTKFVTIGGAIASDIHGKNHHQVGTFSAFVEELELLTATGVRIICSRKNHPHIFYATCGGMGLTGFILRASLRLMKISSDHMCQQIIKTKDINETLAVLFANQSSDYSVAWLDCSAAEKQLGRSIIFLARHGESNDCENFIIAANKKEWPFLDRAAPFLNAQSIKLFNALYYHRHKPGYAQIPLEHYFYPLDAIPNWNQLYGKNGFTQYQFVVPHSEQHVLKKILAAIRFFGTCSFLSVLKILGPANANYLSFPMEGLTMAVDFKISAALWPFLNQLDKQIIDAGGRIYLTKDSRLPETHFRLMYPQLEHFLAVKRELDPLNKIQSLQSLRLNI